jgi:hypothetical protein
MDGSIQWARCVDSSNASNMVFFGDWGEEDGQGVFTPGSDFFNDWPLCRTGA